MRNNRTGWVVLGVFMITLAVMFTAWCVWIGVGEALASPCYATSCQVVPCSASMSAENGLHTPDDAIAKQIDVPIGCDDSAKKVP